MTVRSFLTYHRLLLSVGVILAALVALLSSAADAQTGDEVWSTPAKLHEGSGTMREPVLAPDQSGMLHGFWVYIEEGFPATIFYTHWDGNTWTKPIDVIAMQSIQGPSAAVDPYGRIHLIWQGPGNTLLYSTADAVDASAANAWTPPVSLDQSNYHAHIVIDTEGILHVVYPAPAEGGVLYLTSSDGGQNWSQPSLVASPVQVNATTDFTRIAVAPNGDLHVVWTEYTLPSGAPTLGIYYARSADSGLTWSDPVEIAGDGYIEANIVAVDQEEIYIVWNAGVAISGRYLRWSSDGGQSWSEIREIASPELGGGSTNPPALSLDSAGTIHVLVNTSPNPAVLGADATMYLYGREDNWSAPLDISQEAEGYIGTRNEASALAVVKGNLLSAMFVDNAGTRIWHTWKTSPAPFIAAPGFLPGPVNRTEATPTEADLSLSSPTVTQTPVLDSPGTAPSAFSLDNAQPAATDPFTPLIVGVLPAVVIVAGVVLVSLRRRRTR